MVNTFVTYLHEVPTNNIKHKKSAKNLDIERLFKQIVEAKQILDILNQIRLVADYFDWGYYDIVNLDELELSSYDVISNYLDRVKIYLKIKKRYSELPIRLFIRDGEICEISKKKKIYRINKTVDKWVDNNDGTVTIWVNKSTHPRKLVNSRILTHNDEYNLSFGKRFKSRIPCLFSKDDVCFPEDTYISLGFGQHAINKMWVGYENSLKEYINSHIDVYLTKKKKNGDNRKTSISKYDLSNEIIIHPWWLTRTNCVVLSHRASLLRKTYTRKDYRKIGEEYYRWYRKIPNFEESCYDWMEFGYIWTGSLNNDSFFDLITMCEGGEPDKSMVCFPINADDQPNKKKN